MVVIIVQRIFLLVCVTCVVIGIAIALLANINRKADSLQPSILGRRSLRNDKNLDDVVVVVTASQRGSQFYDLSHFTKDEKRGLVEMAYSVTKLGDAIDWNLQRNNFIKSVVGSHRHHRGQQISVRTFNNGNDDAYNGDIDDTLHDAPEVFTVKGGDWNVGAHEGGMKTVVGDNEATVGNDDTYSGGIDDTLGIISSPIESAVTAVASNDDAYGGKIDDTLDGIGVVSAISKPISIKDGNDDAYDGESDDTLPSASASSPASSNHHASVNAQSYLRYDRHRHRRLQGNDNIDGDVFDGYEYDQGACPNAGSLDVPCAPSNLSSICNKYDRVNGSFQECLEACKPAFCCIHDAPRESNHLAPNCNTDENCPQYNYCYIVWWKLHDTVGPALFMNVDQDDKFFDGAEDLVDPNSTGDPFMVQVLLHHFDDIDEVIEDGLVDNEFEATRIFLDEEYWLYPESGKVDINND